MLTVLLATATSWSPSFHQMFAREYMDRYMEPVTEEQKKSFYIGSMYADGIDKSISHFVRPVIRELNSITNRQSNLYYFFLGVLNHVAADTFAHADREKSFITGKGLKHHFSEIVMCSWAHRQRKLEFLTLPEDLARQINGVGIRVNHKFNYLYFICYHTAKFLPLHWLMPFIQQGECQATTYKGALCNFEQHYEAMMKSAKLIMDHSHDASLNEVDVKTFSLSELQKIRCCEENFTASITPSAIPLVYAMY